MKIIGTKFILKAKYKKELASGVLYGEFPAWIKVTEKWINTRYHADCDFGTTHLARHTLKKYYRKA